MKITVDQVFSASPDRYEPDVMKSRRCGNSGLSLSELSLGFWWNFGGIDPFYSSREKVLWAFDNGIYCFDLANNYGPPYGTGEETLGRLMLSDLKPYRHELVITTKAGYDMWEGPNGKGSSRKMLLTSIDESLKRMNIEYVDIFYSHRFDVETPLEETALALHRIVSSGKAIYTGLSNYPAPELKKMLALLKELKVPCIIYQGRHNFFARDNEKELLPILEKNSIGYTPFSPLAKGLLTDKYLKGIPEDSRASLGKHFNNDDINERTLAQISELNEIAHSRGQSLAQMSVSWLLNMKETTSVIIGPRTLDQLKELHASIRNTSFTSDEISNINRITSRK